MIRKTVKTLQPMFDALGKSGVLVEHYDGTGKNGITVEATRDMELVDRLSGLTEQSVFVIYLPGGYPLRRCGYVKVWFSTLADPMMIEADHYQCEHPNKLIGKVIIEHITKNLGDT